MRKLTGDPGSWMLVVDEGGSILDGDPPWKSIEFWKVSPPAVWEGGEVE